MYAYWLYFILLDPFSLAIQGGSKTLHNEQDRILLDWSIGQPASFDVFNKDYPITISGGFLQNKNCDRCLFKTLDSFLVQLKMGPNPVEHFLSIQINQAGIIWQGAEIYNMEGRLIQKMDVKLSGLHLKYILNFNQYAKGIYFLKCYFLVDQQFPIIKTIQIYKT
jgi:hypothetical protein